MAERFLLREDPLNKVLDLGLEDGDLRRQKAVVLLQVVLLIQEGGQVDLRSLAAEMK